MPIARRVDLVLLLMKTAVAIPYTSVFIELGCGYWPAEAEEIA